MLIEKMYMIMIFINLVHQLFMYIPWYTNISWTSRNKVTVKAISYSLVNFCTTTWRWDRISGNNFIWILNYAKSFVIEINEYKFTNYILYKFKTIPICYYRDVDMNVTDWGRRLIYCMLNISDSVSEELFEIVIVNRICCMWTHSNSVLIFVP